MNIIVKIVSIHPARLHQLCWGGVGRRCYLRCKGCIIKACARWEASLLPGYMTGRNIMAHKYTSTQHRGAGEGEGESLSGRSNSFT